MLYVLFANHDFIYDYDADHLTVTLIILHIIIFGNLHTTFNIIEPRG